MLPAAAPAFWVKCLVVVVAAAVVAVAVVGLIREVTSMAEFLPLLTMPFVAVEQLGQLEHAETADSELAEWKPGAGWDTVAASRYRLLITFRDLLVHIFSKFSLDLRGKYSGIRYFCQNREKHLTHKDFCLIVLSGAVANRLI